MGVRRLHAVAEERGVAGDRGRCALARPRVRWLVRPIRCLDRPKTEGATKGERSAYSTCLFGVWQLQEVSIDGIDGGV